MGSKKENSLSMIEFPRKAQPAGQGLQFGELLREARKRAGKSQIDVAESLGVTRNSVINWESNRYKPDVDLLPKLCSLLDLSIPELFQLADANTLSGSEKALLSNYRMLSGIGQKVVSKMILSILDEEQKARQDFCAENFRIFKKQAGGVAAGSGADYVEIPPEPVFLKIRKSNRHADAIVRVIGESMVPVYHDGDYVYFRETPSASPGDDVVCTTASGCIVKRMGNDRNVFSVNGALPFHASEDDHVMVRGVVTGVVDPSDYPDPEDEALLSTLFEDELRAFDQ